MRIEQIVSDKPIEIGCLVRDYKDVKYFNGIVDADVRIILIAVEDSILKYGDMYYDMMHETTKEFLGFESAAKWPKVVASSEYINKNIPLISREFIDEYVVLNDNVHSFSF